MPLGIVNDSDFEKEVSNGLIQSNPTNKTAIKPVAEIINPIRPGRKPGDVNVPDSLRKLIGATSVTDGREEALAIAGDFGISPASVSAYANGATSTASYDKQPNVRVIDEAKGRVIKRARGKLMLALSKLTPEKIEASSARDIASVAKQMSGIVKDMEPPKPKEEIPDNLRPQFIVYAPQLKQENHYEVVHAKE